VSRFVGGVRFSVDRLIYCVAIIDIGFQAVLFALLSRLYAIQEGLFPKSITFRLERGIIVGTVLLLIDVALLYSALSIWSRASFGDLNPEQVTRIVVSSSLSLSLGFEVILSSFLLSMLKLNVRAFPMERAPLSIVHSAV
jgi:hypothetical protein